MKFSVGALLVASASAFTANSFVPRRTLGVAVQPAFAPIVRAAQT